VRAVHGAQSPLVWQQAEDIATPEQLLDYVVKHKDGHEVQR